MNRFRIGCAILAVLFVLGLGAQRVMQKMLPIAQQVQIAAQLAEAGDYPGATAQLEEAEASWEKIRNLTACLADHQPMEDIECLFAQLENEAAHFDFPAQCRALSRRLEAMAEAHSVNWGTIF